MGAWVFGTISLLAVPMIVPPARAADRAARAVRQAEAAEARVA